LAIIAAAWTIFSAAWNCGFEGRYRRVVTDGGFRPDGTFVRWPGWPSHDTLQLTEAFRRAVLRLFVRRGLFDAEQAQGMLQWPHSGFHVHAGVRVPEADLAFALRLARYCARNPVALDRIAYDAASEQVTYRSDKADGPTAGTATVDRLEFLARLVTHIPDPGQVMQRYALAARDTRGFVKLVADAGMRKLIGAHILATEAGEMITEPLSAPTNGLWRPNPKGGLRLRKGFSAQWKCSTTISQRA
jgi:hypothetical protein